jgi:hypothetical protein
MHSTTTLRRSGRRFVLALSILTLMVTGSTVVLAQSDSGTGAGDRTRQQDQLQQRDQLRQRLQDGIDTAGLTANERQQMTQNLEACLRLSLSDNDVATLFPQSGESQRFTSGTLLRFQNRVLAMEQEGLPSEPLVTKLQEARTKGISDTVLDQVTDRMEAHVRAAHRIMVRAVDDGVSPAEDPAQERRMTQVMARQMWRGLSEEQMDQLRERARERVRSGDCSLDQLATAAETAAQIREEGLAPERAVRLAGEALRQGYTVQQMHQLRWMVMASHRHGGPVDDVADDMEDWLQNRMQIREMAQHMIQAGWMGPGDMQGPGGHGPMDNIGEGPGNQGGHGSDNDHGHGGDTDGGNGSH